MADNPLVKGAAGVSFRPLSDEVVTRNGVALDQDNVQAQVIKIATGGDGVATDVGSGNPFPTADAAVAAAIAGLLSGTLTVAPSTAGDVATGLTNGRKTVTTPAAAVALRASLACKWVTVTALAANTAKVFVGGAGVLATAGSETGIPLSALESVTVPVSNAATVFVDALVAGEGVSFVVGA